MKEHPWHIKHDRRKHAPEAPRHRGDECEWCSPHELSHVGPGDTVAGVLVVDGCGWTCPDCLWVCKEA